MRSGKNRIRLVSQTSRKNGDGNMSKHCKHWICARVVGFSLLVSAGATAALAQSGSSLSQSGLVGKLEGAELVKQGKLPPVQDRIPQEPLVVKPVKETGKYGGTWRLVFKGPGAAENG